MSGISGGQLPSRLVIVAGTYDGVLAGWDTVEHVQEQEKNDIELKILRKNNDGRHLKLSFAMAAHEGSVRCLDIGAATPAVPSKKSDSNSNLPDDRSEEPGALLSGGFDETINIFNLQKHAQSGELKTPNDLGSPLCCSFAPPLSSGTPPSHALVGLTSGKIVLYKKRDWSVQHVLSGHDEGGVQCLAVHPTGKMALTGGRDGKIILWDLMKGRLAFVHKVPTLGKVKGRKETVNHIVWSDDGNRYAFCYATKITARDVNSGEDLLDVDLPSRVNQLSFIGGPEGMFLAAACDDGGLPVLEVGQLEEEEDANTRRAIMAIEPVDRVVAGDDRLKCIRSVRGGNAFLVVTANSGGVVSVLDLEGAARMMLTGNERNTSENGDNESRNNYSESESDSDDEIEAAVEILDSVRVGSGARITNLTVWSSDLQENSEDIFSQSDEAFISSDEKDESDQERKVKNQEPPNKIELDEKAVQKARKLVVQAKKRQKKQSKKPRT